MIKYLVITISIGIGIAIGALLSPADAMAPAPQITAIAYRSADARLSPLLPPVVVVPVVVVAPAHSVKRCVMFEPAFAAHGLLPVNVFSMIAYRESRCRINAINAKWNAAGEMTWALNKNRTYDSGLLQINSSWKTVTRQVCGGGLDLLLTLDCNLKVARYLLDNGGLNHWRATATP